MNLTGVRGAPELVTYHRSVAAVTAEERCMRGSREDMESDGSMLREMHGPERGVRRRIMQLWAMC